MAPGRLGMAKRNSKGGIGGTALGFLALGFSSAVFGALVVGPRLGGALAEKDPKPLPAAYAAKPADPPPTQLAIPHVDDLAKSAERLPEQPAPDDVTTPE